MGLAKQNVKDNRKYTVEEYLKMERKAFERHEYLNGEIYQMAGESDAHGIVSVNLSSEIHQQLKGSDCQLRSKDAKIASNVLSEKKSSMKGLFSYPDIVIICGEPEYHDECKDIILNPKVIIEVLSESTELFDRNTKFVRYREFNPTLTDYILVSQDKPMVEHFIRQADESWKMYAFFGLDEMFSIESINCELNLADVYDRVEFSKESLNFLEEIKDAK